MSTRRFNTLVDSLIAQDPEADRRQTERNKGRPQVTIITPDRFARQFRLGASLPAIDGAAAVGEVEYDSVVGAFSADPAPNNAAPTPWWFGQGPDRPADACEACIAMPRPKTTFTTHRHCSAADRSRRHSIDGCGVDGCGSGARPVFHIVVNLSTLLAWTTTRAFSTATASSTPPPCA